MKIRILSICLIATLSAATSISAGELLQDFFKTINLPKLNISDSDETPVISTLEAVGEETGKVVNEVGSLLEQLVSPAPTKKEPKADAATPAKIQSDVKTESKTLTPAKPAKKEATEKEAKTKPAKKRAIPAPILSPAEFLKKQKDKSEKETEK
ncbi:MAG: hypothetical protein MK006_14160 [Pirellulales bacterium]|nr:hypothetical protein [Pirellulales bacterium]